MARPPIMAPGAFPTDLSRHSTNRRLRQERALQLQRRYGNRSTVARLGRPSLPRPVQRETAAGSGTRSTQVPGLSQAAVSTAQSNLTSNPQAAIDAVTADLVRQGQINLSYLAGNQMHYAPRAQLPARHYGHTSLTPGTGRPRPCRVIIGQDALRSVGILYTTIMHEWQHVNQFRTGPATGRGEAMDETEARLWEVENLEQSGLWRDTQYMSVLPGQLNHWWNLVPSGQQPLLAARYRRAQQTLRTMQQRRLDEQFRQQTGR